MNPIITEMTEGKGWRAHVDGNSKVYEYGESETVAISKLLLRLQGKRVSSISGAFLFASACWVSWFILTWLWILGVVAMEGTTTIWSLFLLLGLFGSAYATRK